MYNYKTVKSTKKQLQSELLLQGATLIGAPWGESLEHISQLVNAWAPSEYPSIQPDTFRLTSRGRLKRVDRSGEESALILTATETVYTIGPFVRVVFSTYEDSTVSAIIYLLGEAKG